MAGLEHTSERDAPLAGRSIIVTRAVDQAAGLAVPLEALGAEVLVMPVIEITGPESWEPADGAIDGLDSYDWVVLTSSNGVDAFAERLRMHGLHFTDLTCKRVAVIGSATAARVRELGVEPTIVPDESRAEGLVAAFAGIGAEAGPRVLIPRAAEAREVLPDELRALGFTVDVVPVYQVVTPIAPAEVLDRIDSGDIDAVVFASGGTARRFAQVLADAGMDAADALVGPVVASIGPVTTAALHELGIPVDVEAADPTVTSLVKAVVDRFGARPR